MAGDKADFTVRLIDRVSGAARSAGNALGGLGRALGSTGKAAGHANKEASSFAETVASFAGGNLLAHGIERAAEAFVELGKEVLETTYHLTVFGQNAEFAFNQLAKHGATGEKLFEHARALAERFGLELEDTTEAYSNFLKLQFNPKQIDGLIRVGADLKALGANAEEVKGIFLGLGEIKSIGSLQARQLLMLEQRGISGQLIREDIGKQLGGKSVDEVNKLMHKGKISAEVGIQAIQNAIVKKLQEKNLGDVGAKYADTTIEGIEGRFKAFAEGKGLDITKALQKPFTELAGNAFNKFQSFFKSPDGAKTIEELSAGLGKMLDVTIQIGKAFGSGFIGGIESMYEGAKPFLDLFTGDDGKAALASFTSLAEDLGKLTAAAVGFGVAFVGVGVVLGETLALAYNVGDGVVHAIVDPLFNMVGGITKWWDQLAAIWNNGATSFVELAFDIGKQIVLGLNNGLAAMIDYIPNTLDAIADNVIGAFKKTFGIHSPSVVMADIGENVGLGLGVGIESTAGDVASASRGVALGSVGAMSDVMSAHPAWNMGKTWGTLGAPSLEEGRASKPVDYGPIGASSAAAPMPLGDVRGSRDMTFAPVTHVSVEVGRGDPQDTADAVGNEVDRRMEAWFRQLEMEG